MVLLSLGKRRGWGLPRIGSWPVRPFEGRQKTVISARTDNGPFLCAPGHKRGMAKWRRAG